MPAGDANRGSGRVFMADLKRGFSVEETHCFPGQSQFGCVHTNPRAALLSVQELALRAHRGYYLSFSDVKPLFIAQRSSPMSVRFTQSCPTCGRRVQIQASLLGRTVACQHCQGEFVAESGLKGDAIEDGSESGKTDPLMERVELALQRASAETAVG